MNGPRFCQCHICNARFTIDKISMFPAENEQTYFQVESPKIKNLPLKTNLGIFLTWSQNKELNIVLNGTYTCTHLSNQNTKRRNSILIFLKIQNSISVEKSKLIQTSFFLALSLLAFETFESEKALIKNRNNGIFRLALTWKIRIFL